MTWRRFLEGLGWLVVLGGAWTLASAWLGITRHLVTVAAQAFGPLLLFAVWPVAVAALVGKRWALAAAAVALCVAHLAIIVPLVRRDSQPTWAASAPTISVLAANVLYLNYLVTEGAATIAAADVDVIVLVELTPSWVSALRTAGVLDRFPHHVLFPAEGNATGSAILSKRPLVADHEYTAGRRSVHSVEVAVGTQRLEIVELHPQAPSAGLLLRSWSEQIRDHGLIVDRRKGPMVMAGDLNASYLNPPYRELLSHGLRDAHEVTGQGFSFSFPIDSGIPPVVRLDHALVTSDVAVLSVHDVTIPGSDHRAFITKLAVKQ